MNAWMIAKLVSIASVGWIVLISCSTATPPTKAELENACRISIVGDPANMYLEVQSVFTRVAYGRFDLTPSETDATFQSIHETAAHPIDAKNHFDEFAAMEVSLDWWELNTDSRFSLIHHSSSNVGTPPNEYVRDLWICAVPINHQTNRIYIMVIEEGTN